MANRDLQHHVSIKVEPAIIFIIGHKELDHRMAAYAEVLEEADDHVAVVRRLA